MYNGFVFNVDCIFLDYLNKKLSGGHNPEKIGEHNLQNRIEKKTLSKLSKSHKIPLILPGRTYGQKASLMGLYWGRG